MFMAKWLFCSFKVLRYLCYCFVNSPFAPKETCICYQDPKHCTTGKVMADPICCRHFQTIIVIIASLQFLLTKCISNSLSLALIPPPILPKDCFSLITALDLSSAVFSWPAQQYTTFIIYELKYLQTLYGTANVIQVSHLYSGLENSRLVLLFVWVQQPALPLCQ